MKIPNKNSADEEIIGIVILLAILFLMYYFNPDLFI